MLMMKKILVACGLSFSLAACMGAPEDLVDSEAGEPSTDSVQQPLPSTGWIRTYYSDATRTTEVGYENYDCAPDYRSLEGSKTKWAREYHYDCMGSHTPGFPMTQCVECKPVSAPFGSCSLVSC
jgi:hypothetical protein